MYPKHSCHFRQTVGGCHNVCIQFLILYRAIIALGCIPSFKARLGHSTLAQGFDNFKMPFGNQFVGSCFFQPKALTKLLYRICSFLQFLTGRGSIDLLVFELVSIPFLKTVDHHPHGVADKNGLEVIFLNEPVRLSFAKAEHPAHFRDRHTRSFSCFCHRTTSYVKNVAMCFLVMATFYRTLDLF